MPSRERVQGLIARAVRGEFVEALEEYYHHDATMQENLDPPRVGLPALVANERAVMAHFKQIRTSYTEPVFVDGDHAVIHWVFEFADAEGKTFRLDELAYQRWKGDKIAEERFYYDPAQRKG